MTFDEAATKVENIVGDLNIPLGVENALLDAIEILRDEYAPTIEMTKEQHDYIDPLIQQGKELGATFTEFWEVYKFIGASKKIDRTFDRQEQAMLAWLHPETIKIVDE
ncbi:hypothetical protein J3330_09275 [Leuconostoc mesenteroides]|uniref:hypothetical protein n=1 Tax=Leuconostoc mesenteroides TaxID=1245 RepID=UPI001CBAD5D6|nr:hypothetical protein [Leuconostoc mesenteroides]MBZ1519290.1 hypothetical protein [Leuconostoc mesenteroides]MBZ1520362.1 hypothetical protein [Leuconostoc mesenteroides]